MNLKKAILLRTWIAFLMVLVLAVAIIWQVIDLQFNKKDKYMAIKDEQSTKWRVIQASRGNIYAEDGSLLATSIPKYELRMDTKVETVTNEYFFSHVDTDDFSGASDHRSRNEGIIACARAKVDNSIAFAHFGVFCWKPASQTQVGFRNVAL